jgi:hypothetical protein
MVMSVSPEQYLICLMLISIIVLSTCLLLYKDKFAIAPIVYAFTSPAAGSPSFPNHEIIDAKLDWIDMKTRNYTKGGDRSTDIESVDYFSDGKSLNATLWLYFPFKVQPRSSDENVNYGMYVD